MSSDGTYPRRASRRGARASQQSSRVSPSSAAAVLIMAGILGFIGGAIVGAAGGDPEGAAAATNTATQTPGEGDASGEESPEASPGNDEGDHTVSLVADPTTVGINERIDLAGNLEPPVEGVTLRVERRLEGEDWTPFGNEPVVTETRDDGSFSTWVQTGREGTNEFRLVGEVDGERIESQTVTVTVQGSGDD